MLPTHHFICKDPPSRLHQKYLPAKVNFAPLASRSSRRQGVQGFDPAVKYPSVSIRRGLMEVPAFINSRQVSLNPRGCLHSLRLTNGLAGFFDWKRECSYDSERWLPGAPKQSP